MTRIRPFRPGDEPALAEICTRTAEAGADATGLLTDDGLWGDLFVLPYVARHPDLAWVVEADDGRVVGYVVATDDTDGFERWFRDVWWPAHVDRYVREGGRTSQLLASGDERGPGRTAHAAEYPAHLHIDLLPETQGAGLGRRLIETLVDELTTREVPGLHLGVDPRNTSAASFYDRLGFVRLPPETGSVTYGMRLPTR